MYSLSDVLNGHLLGLWIIVVRVFVSAAADIVHYTMQKCLHSPGRYYFRNSNLSKSELHLWIKASPTFVMNRCFLDVFKLRSSVLKPIHYCFIFTFVYSRSIWHAREVTNRKQEIPTRLLNNWIKIIDEQHNGLLVSLSKKATDGNEPRLVHRYWSSCHAVEFGCYDIDARQKSTRLAKLMKVLLDSRRFATRSCRSWWSLRIQTIGLSEAVFGYHKRRRSQPLRGQIRTSADEGGMS